MLQCVVLEPTKQFHDPLGQKYKKFFAKAGYDVNCIFVETEKDLRKILTQKNMDIFISDLSFDTEDFAGLLVVRSIKIDFPDIFIIGNSRADIGYRQVAARLPSFDLFIEKGGLYGDDASYLEETRKEFLNKFRRNPDIVISEKSEFLDDSSRKIKKRDFESLVSQVLFFGHGSDGAVTPKEAVFIPLSGGRSSSMVYKLLGQNQDGHTITVPAVFKISPIQNALCEKANYDAYVKWILPYSWRVDILGFGVTKKWGAVCYSFIKSGYDDFDALAKYIMEGKDQIIKEAFSKVFDPSKKHWYSDHFLSKESNINERYDSRYFGSVSTRNETSRFFIENIQNLFNANVSPNGFRVFGEKYMRPEARLFGQPNGDYHSCICHGDLNGNNLIVSESGEVIFIDFQETGRGHVFEDFVTMEAGLRLNYLLHDEQPKENEWLEFLDAERKVSKIENLDSHKGLFKHIWSIRSLAKQNFPFEDFSSYYYGVAAFNFRLLRLKGLTSTQIGRTIIAILVALENLN